MFFQVFFTVLILSKNYLNKFISSIFTSKNNSWLSKTIINATKFVSKTTRNVILIYFCVRTSITFNTFSITLKISINFKWNWYLFEITTDPSSSFTDCLPLMLKQCSSRFVNISSRLKRCKQLLQNHFLLLFFVL